MARDELTPQSGAMASLAEMAYRRNDGVRQVENDDGTITDIVEGDGQYAAPITHIDTVDGYRAVNPLESPAIQARAAAAGQTSAEYIEDQFGLTVDPVDRGDGLTHFYSDNGFSGYFSLREDDPSTPEDETSLVLTARGTDIADTPEGAMGNYLVDTFQSVLGNDTKESFEDGLESPGWAKRASRWTANRFRDEENQISGNVEEHTDYGVRQGYARDNMTGEFLRDENGERIADPNFGNERIIDPGDMFTNYRLGKGTYTETQYDDTKAAFEMGEIMSEDYGDAPVAVNGQSLGGGLAGLVAVESGAESHTFGMAPFAAQMRVVAQRNVIREMVEDPANEAIFGDLGEQMRNASPRERMDMERSLAETFDGMDDVSSDRRGAQTIINRRINAFNEEHGANIDRGTIRDFNRSSAERLDEYEANAEDINASTVMYEFTTNAAGDDERIHFDPLGTLVDAGSSDIVDDRDMHIIDLGRQVPGAGSESLTRHSPAFNELMINSQDRGERGEIAADSTDYVGGQFSEVFRNNEHFKNGAFHEPGLMGGVTRGKEGQDNDMSASRTEMPTNETVYRALSLSERGDGQLYDYATDFFLGAGGQGRTQDGMEMTRSNDVGDRSLASGTTQLGMQILRDDVQGTNYQTIPTGEDAMFAGDYRTTGYVELDLTRIDSEHFMNYRRDGDGNPIMGQNGIHGMDSIQGQILDETRAGLSEGERILPGSRADTETRQLAEDLTGASNRYVGRRQGRDLYNEQFLDVQDGELEFGSVVVQTGATRDLTIALDDLASANPDNTRITAEGAAVFLGEGNDTVTGGDGKDYAMLGGGDDTYIRQDTRGEVDGDLIVGGEGRDMYTVGGGGPVMATIDGNVTRVASRTAGSDAELELSTDNLVSIEVIQGSDTADVFTAANLSSNRYIDGAGGDDNLVYGALGDDYVLDTSDGVDADGNAYSARISNGDTTLYVINIDDENITRETQPEAEASGERASLDTTVNQLDADFATVQQTIADHAADGTLTLDEARLGKALSQSGTPQIFADLETSGVTQLNMPEHDATDPVERTRAAIEAGTEALAENGLPLPESEYQPELDQTGVSNEVFAEADARGDIAGELHLQESLQTAQLEAQQANAARLGAQEQEMDAAVA